MKPVRCFCGFLWLVMVFCVAQSGAQLPPFSHAKLLMCEGLPCVDAVVGGKHLRLAVDTGNPNSALDAKAALAAGLSLQPVNGADGKPIAGFQKAVANDVVIGDVAFKELRFLVIDLSSAIKDKTFPDVDGTIAYGAFKDRIVQLDYPGGTLSVSQPLTSSTACLAACGDISLITFGHRGPPIVTTTGFTVNGKPMSVQVDTMFTGTLLVFPTSVEKLGLSSEAQSKASQYFAFTDEGVDMFRSEAQQLGFGSKTLATKAPLYFAGPKVHLPDGLFDGTVGAELLGRHKVTFDFHDNKFWLD
jgi:Aspartyl protease